MAPVYLLRILIMAVVLFLCTGFYFLYQFLHKTAVRQEKEKIVGTKRRGKNTKLFKLYQITSDFAPTKRFVRKLVMQYELRMPSDYKGAREAAMRTALILWSLSVVAVAVAVFAGVSAYTLSCVVLFVMLASGDYVSNQLETWDLELITQLDLFVDETRHYFFETQDVAESLKMASDGSKLKLMKQHANKLLAVVTADDIMKAARKYNQTTQDVYMKRFLASCATIAQYGDKTVNDESLFLSSIRDLKNDILIEKIRRRSVSTGFSGLLITSYAPYFGLGWLGSFARGTFESVGDALGGTYGAVVTVIAFFWAYITHLIVSILKVAPQIDTDTPVLLQRLYRWASMKKLVNRILSKNWGRTLRKQSILRKTGSNLTVQLHETKKILIFCFAAVAAIVFMVGLRAHNKEMYVNNLTGIINTTSGASDEVYLQMYWWTLAAVEEHNAYDVRIAYNRESGAEAAMDYDSEVEKYLSQKVAAELETKSMPFAEERAFEAMQDFLAEFSSTSLAIVNLNGLTYHEAANSADGIVRNAMGVFRKILQKGQLVNCFENYPDEARDVADFVAKRICKSRKEYFRWYDLLVCFLFAVAAYCVPEIIILLTKRSFQMQMQDEVIQFESVILVLMYIERMTVEEILVWMAMFSRVFKKSLQTCICYFPIENEAAIDNLALAEPFEPFVRLIQNLKVCDRVGVERAFNGLSSERKNYQELRKQENEIAVANNVRIANAVSRSTTTVAIVTYMVGPFAIGAIGELTSSLNALSTITNS